MIDMTVLQVVRKYELEAMPKYYKNQLGEDVSTKYGLDELKDKPVRDITIRFFNKRIAIITIVD